MDDFSPEYCVEVIADSSGKWCSNGATFSNVTEAVWYAQNLTSRWTAVREWRILANHQTPESPEEWRVITLPRGES